jgi:hypothetical protein
MDQIAPTLENILKESAAAAEEAQRLAELCPMYSSALNQFAGRDSAGSGRIES